MENKDRDKFMSLDAETQFPTVYEHPGKVSRPTFEDISWVSLYVYPTLLEPC